MVADWLEQVGHLLLELVLKAVAAFQFRTASFGGIDVKYLQEFCN